MKHILPFLKNLKENNSREWFDVNKPTYQKAKEEFVLFTQQVIQECVKFDPLLIGTDAAKSIFRINRDVRFSKDKSPYKTNFGASINPGGKKSMIPGYYIHIEPGKSFLAAGCYMPEANFLSAIRQEIDYNFDEFTTIVKNKKFIAEFGKLSEEDALKKIPKGYEKENPAADFLKMKHFIALKDISDHEIVKPDFHKSIAKTFAASLDLNKFLRRVKEV